MNSSRPCRPGSSSSSRRPCRSMTSGPQIWIRRGRLTDRKVTPTSSPYLRSTKSLEDPMARLIRCECGFTARGNDDDEVITVIREHMATDHPALLRAVSKEDLLGWIQVE